MCASAGWKWLQTREVNSHLLQMVGGANCGATKHHSLNRECFPVVDPAAASSLIFE